MMVAPQRLAFIGLTLSSSWGNGHATTYRSLLKGLHALGHEAHFFERNVPWYESSRDLPAPDFCQLHLYDNLQQLERLIDTHGAFDAIVVGSYVPEGVDVITRCARMPAGSFCFYDIDTPVTLAKLEQEDAEYLTADQIPLFDVYLSFAGGQVLQRLVQDFGAQRAEALYCSVDTTLYAPTGDNLLWDLGYLGTYSADRQPTLDRLLLETARRCPDLRFVVAGPQYPDAIDWPANVERIGHVPPALHAWFYCSQRFTLNVTRQAMVSAGFSPSVRLFEAAACGTPVISDWWEGLEALLPPGRAVHLVSRSQEVERLLRRQSDDERNGMAEEAGRIVRQHHTGLARASQLLAILHQGSAGQTRPRMTSATVA